MIYGFDKGCAWSLFFVFQEKFEGSFIKKRSLEIKTDSF